MTGYITTFAGSTNGCSGDGGPATAAKLSSPRGLAVDGAGNLYISDSANNVVRKVNASTGIISTVAGNGQYGFSGDGGPAISAEFTDVVAVALDSANNLYVEDPSNNRIRKVDASTGIVTTIARNGTRGFAGDGGLSTSAEFDYPDGLAIDGAGNLYIADLNNYRTRKLAVSGTALAFASTVVGSTSSDSPRTVSVSNIGNAALTFPLPTTGLNPSISTGFTFGNSSTCPQVSPISSPATLAAGASCTALISFTPTVSGSIGGSVVLTDNALNAAGPAYATQAILLSGTATAPPLVATTAVAAETLTAGYAASAFTPVTESGGTGTLTYSVSPTLPGGLIFSPSTGAVSGTATGTRAAATYTVTVTDASSTTATATFSLAVNAAVSASTAVSSTALTVGHAAAFTPVTAMGGTGTLSYSVSPTLPAGLAFNASTGAVNGTATGSSAIATYTVTAIDTNGATGTATFSLSVNAAVSASTAVSSTALTVGHAAAFAPVTAAGGTGTLSYSVSPTLPLGLAFNASTGAVSGTATGVSGAATYNVIATDANGATGTATFSLTVNGPVAATTAAASIALTQGQPATALLPVTASGGTGALLYSISPALPAGLVFSAVTGTVRGTATGASGATTYTVTATDTIGATGQPPSALR